MGDEVVIAALKEIPASSEAATWFRWATLASPLKAIPTPSRTSGCGRCGCHRPRAAPDLGVGAILLAATRFGRRHRVVPDIGVPRAGCERCGCGRSRTSPPGVIDGESVTDDPALAEQEALGAEHRNPVEVVVGRRDPPQRIPRPLPPGSRTRLPNMSVLHHKPGVPTGVVDPRVADLQSPAVGDELVVAVERVPVDIQGDAVGADDDPVVRAVDQVAVKRRVGLDLVAAAQLAGGRLTGAERQTRYERDHRSPGMCG